MFSNENYVSWLKKGLGNIESVFHRGTNTELRHFLQVVTRFFGPFLFTESL